MLPRQRRERTARDAAAWLLLVAGTAVGAVGCGEGASADPRPAAEPPTFARDVAPIVFEHCASCHRPEGPAPFSLLTYEEVKGRAARIARVAEERTMPPWLPEPGYGEFQGERVLAPEEIETIRRWVEAGAPEGDPARTPDPPLPESGWQLGPPDLVLEMPEPFTVPAGGGDIFRNFVLPVPIEETRYVRAADLRPGDTRAVHHAMMMLDRTATSRMLDAEDERPGFDGMLHGEAEMPLGFLLGWTPGKAPAPEPHGLAWELEPGTDMVLQLHLRPTGREETVRARLGLYFAEEPPERRPFTLHLVDMTIDIPPGAASYEATDSYTLPVDVEALGIYPHAHYLGDRMELTAELPDGSARWLLRIEEWDFDWQDAYRYAEPVHLPKGTVLSMRFTYDNTADNPRNPNRPPARVRYGPESSDEMGDLWLQVLPLSEKDRPVLARDVARKELASRIEFWRWRLESDPGDADALQGLGFVLHSLGRLDEAVDHYRRALESRPGQALTHYNLALALESRGDVQEAVRHYRETIRRQPGHADAHNNLGRALLGLGRSAEAERHWRRALEADPRHALAHNNLGNLLRTRGREREAIDHLEEAIALRRDYPEARFNLGLALMGEGRAREAVGHFREAARLDPENPRILAFLGWTLATSPDPAIRDPGAAVRAARRAAELTERRDPAALQALAAAHAAEGHFEAAVAVAERALERATATGAETTAATLRGLLELFRQGRPYRTGGDGER